MNAIDQIRDALEHYAHGDIDATRAREALVVLDGLAGQLVPLGLQAKAGSIIVHAEEQVETGHPFDALAIDALLMDSEIVEWLGRLRAQALLPVKRSERG